MHSSLVGLIIVIASLQAYLKSQLDNCSSFRTQLLESSLRPKKWTSPALKSLHCLPVHQRIDFKVLMLVYKALNGLGPKYISDLLTQYEPSRPLRSSGSSFLSVPSQNQTWRSCIQLLCSTYLEQTPRKPQIS